LAPDSETCTACLSTFCLVSRKLHLACCIMFPVSDADEACYYRYTCRTVGMWRPCYGHSAFRWQFRRLFLAPRHGIQLSSQLVTCFNVCQHCLIFVTCSYQRSIEGLHGPVSCRIVLTRHHWMFFMSEH